MNRELRQNADILVSSIDATLNRLRMRGDPLADAVALRLDTPPHHNALSELRFLARSEIGIYQELLDHANSIPDATHFTRIEHGRSVQLAFNTVRQQAWLYGALPQGLGRCPILRADQLPTEIHYRLAFDRQMNHALAEANCLQPGQSLHETLLQRRLQLALQRKLIKESGWNSLEYGEPLNQEYLLLMLLEYRTLTTDNMARLGATLNREDQMAIAAFWRLAGYWLGLDPAVIPDDREEEITLLHRIRWRHSHDKTRQAQQAQVLHTHLQQEKPVHLPHDLPESIIHWCNKASTDSGSSRIPIDRALRFLIIANRGATLAHYHIPGVGSLRQQLNSRQLRQDTHALSPFNDSHQAA